MQGRFQSYGFFSGLTRRIPEQEHGQVQRKRNLFPGPAYVAVYELIAQPYLFAIKERIQRGRRPFFRFHFHGYDRGVAVDKELDFPLGVR